MHLWAHFLDAVMEFYHTKYAMVLLKKIHQGYFEEGLSQKNPAHRFEINYKALLQEIMAYSELNDQINCNDSSNMLLEILAL